MKDPILFLQQSLIIGGERKCENHLLCLPGMLCDGRDSPKESHLHLCPSSATCGSAAAPECHPPGKNVAWKQNRSRSSLFLHCLQISFLPKPGTESVGMEFRLEGAGFHVLVCKSTYHYSLVPRALITDSLTHASM